MSEEFLQLSDLELLSLIARAQSELERRKNAGRQKLRVEIEEKLKSAGFGLADLFPEFADACDAGRDGESTSRPQRPKFKNHVSGETWSGRGRHPPAWVKSILDERDWSLEAFKSSEEFLARE